jgi:hypothetical protein
MLPETLAPAPEIFPSVTVSVELAEGSQLPVLVTMVTFQSPSYGDCAMAGAAVAEMARPKKSEMRAERMNQNLKMFVMERLI